MARIRNIKPEFFLNEDLAELSAETRLAFIGLWTLADWEGRLQERPKRMRLELFPYHPNTDMEQILSGLEQKRFIVRYSVDGENYIQITNFKKHQYISGKEKEKPSQIPAPDRNHTGTKPASTQSSDTTLHSTDNGQGTRDKGQQTTVASPRVSDGFDAFWALYPKKVSKGAAEKAWGKLRPPVEQVLSALDWQRSQPNWVKDNGQFIPNPATYLNAKGWEDEPTALKQGDDGWEPTSEEADRLWPHLFGGTQA